MKTVGIIAEYNPFHNGHAYHISETRKRVGEDVTVVVVMSGDFVQRGETAVFNKYVRAEAACRCGADLVLELPLPWSLSSAEGFAKAGLEILDAFGIDILSFGCESTNLSELTEVAEILLRDDLPVLVRSQLKKYPETSFASARQVVVEELLGKKMDFMSQPNSILAIEYLKTIKKEKLSVSPLAIQRYGSQHDELGGDSFPSASELRSRITESKSITGMLPYSAESLYLRELDAGRGVTAAERLDLLMLSRLRFLEEGDYLTLPDVDEGLARRIVHAVKREKDYSSILRTVSTRRYPLSRIRRVLFYAALGIKEDDMKRNPSYLRVLAFNDRGQELLHNRKETSLPILTKPAQVHSLSKEAAECYMLGSVSHDFYTLFYPSAEGHSAGEEWYRKPAVC